MSATVHELCMTSKRFLEIVRTLVERPDGIGWAQAVLDKPDGRLNLSSAQKCLEAGYLEGEPVRDGEKRWCGVLVATIAGRPMHVSICLETDHESGQKWLNVLKIEE